MKTIAVVYTSMGNLVNTMKTLLKEAFPDYRIVNIADDSLINEVIANGSVTEGVKARLKAYYDAAAVTKPELIISACSSVGAYAEEYAETAAVPVVRIDHAMIAKALETAGRIGVLASLGTTLDPTVDYITRIAKEKGREVEICAKVATGAYEANAKGDKETHNKLLLETAKDMNGSIDVLLLAQGSMASMEQTIADELGVPVFSSPRLCVEETINRLKG